MSKKNKIKVLIFGYGSAGKKYAKYLFKKNFDILIFDPFAKIPSSNFIIFRNYKNLYEYKDRIDFSIISSLSQDHFTNFCAAIHLNIKKILMEKPLTNSFQELLKIKKIVDKKKIKFHTNHSWEYYNLDLFINKIQEKYKTGNPLAFLSYGGAFCLSTGAIHLYNILLRIFKINIKKLKIFSNLNISSINPRSKKYRTFGGIAHLFEGKKNITFNYSNQSKIRTRQIFIYKAHKLIFSIDGSYSLYRTSKKNDNKQITFLEEPKLINKGKMYKRNNIILAADSLIKNKIKVGYFSAYKSLIILFSIICSNYLKKITTTQRSIKFLKKNKKIFLFT